MVTGRATAVPWSWNAARRAALAGLLALLPPLAGPGAFAAISGERVALVIGNGSYRHVPSLVNPRNDADAIASKLRDIGFDHVEMHHDLDRRGLTGALQAFQRRSDAAALAVVYFAGHGIELGGENYLIPVDARLASDSDIEFEAVRLELVMRSVDRARKLRLVILDACRNNPFAARMARLDATRSVGRGLAKVEPSRDTLIAYAARDGQLALDGRGRNSPFTEALLEHLGTPGLEVQFLFRKVRDSVLRATDQEQDPHVYGSLGGEALYLVPPIEDRALDARLKVDREAMFWNSIAESDSEDDFVEYLVHFPDGLFAGLALNRLKALQSAGGRAPNRAQAAPAYTDPSRRDPLEVPLTPAPDTASRAGTRSQAMTAGSSAPDVPRIRTRDRDPRCYSVLRYAQDGGQLGDADRDFIKRACN